MGYSKISGFSGNCRPVAKAYFAQMIQLLTIQKDLMQTSMLRIGVLPAEGMNQKTSLKGF
jgi:hypothetical protein